MNSKTTRPAQSNIEFSDRQQRVILNVDDSDADQIRDQEPNQIKEGQAVRKRDKKAERLQQKAEYAVKKAIKEDPYL